MLIGQRRAQRCGMTRLCNVARGGYAQGLLLDAFAAAAQYRPLAGINESREAPLEVLIHHVTQDYPRLMFFLRQFGNDSDLHQSLRIDQTLYLHP